LNSSEPPPGATDEVIDVTPAVPQLSAEQVREIAYRAAMEYVSGNPDAVLGAISAAVKLAMDAAQLPGERYHLCHVPDFEEASVRSFDSFDAYLAAWREARQQGGQAFGFEGSAHLVSRGGHYLVTARGRFPLFITEEENEVDPKGYLGQPQRPAPAEPAATPEPEEEGEDLDDEDLDEVEEAPG
jgi:hypothetical protein